MREICPNCMDIKKVEVFPFEEAIFINGKISIVICDVLKCKSCHKIFSTKKYPNTAIEKALELSKKDR